MNNNNPASKIQPGFIDTINKIKKAIAANLNCHNIGRILEFDKDTQTCTIELMQIKQFENQYLTPAPICNVPLIILGTNNSHITFPDPQGTICLLFFMDRNIDSFLETGEQYVPYTGRMHDFTDCIAIATFKTLVNPITNYDDKAITLYYEEIIDEVKNYSYIKLKSNEINLKNSSGGEINIGDKINIKNNSQSLASLIDVLLTACENIATVNGGPLTPDSKQLFVDLKAQFKELLYDNAQS